MTREEAVQILEDACTDAKYYRTRYEYKDTTLKMAKDEATALSVLSALAESEAGLRAENERLREILKRLKAIPATERDKENAALKAEVERLKKDLWDAQQSIAQTNSIFGRT